MKLVPRLQAAGREIERDVLAPLRLGRLGQRLKDLGHGAPILEPAPAPERDRAQPVIVDRGHAEDRARVGEHDRVARGREHLHARRRIGDDLELQRRRHIGDEPLPAAGAPRPASALARRHAPDEGVAVARQADGVAGVRQRDRRELGGGAPADGQQRPARHARRLADGDGLGRTLEIRGIGGADRHVPHERAVGDAHHHGVARAATIAGDEHEVGIDGAQHRGGGAIVHREALGRPRRPRAALGEHERSPLRRPNADAQALTAKHRRRHAFDDERWEQLAGERAHRMAHRAPAVRRDRARGAELGQREHGDAAGDGAESERATPGARRQRRPGRTESRGQLLRGAPPQRARRPHFEHGAQRAVPERALALDRGGDGAARGLAPQRTSRPPRHGRGQREHESPREERRRRPRDPPRIAQPDAGRA